ncbi:MAG: hypothetical protein ABR591_00325 [Candidatus Velthaea sp.]
MAVGLVLEFAGVGRREYEAVNSRLGINMEAGSGDWPDGLMKHTAGTDHDGNLVVMEVWTSRDAQERFMRDRLGAAVAGAGISAVPRLTWLDLLADHHPG